MFLNSQGEIQDNSNHDGPLSVGVPGTVAGLALAHDRLGSMAWGDLVAPSIDLAEDGFPVSWEMEWFMDMLSRRPRAYPSTAKVFLKPGNEPYEPGEILKQPDLAQSLIRIQKEGHDGFYKGETARLMEQFMKVNGGLITQEDMARYEAIEQPPIHGTYRGYDIYSMSPPSSGGIALVTMLNILEEYDLKVAFAQLAG